MASSTVTRKRANGHRQRLDGGSRRHAGRAAPARDLRSLESDRAGLELVALRDRRPLTGEEAAAQRARRVLTGEVRLRLGWGRRVRRQSVELESVRRIATAAALNQVDAWERVAEAVRPGPRGRVPRDLGAQRRVERRVVRA